MGKPNRPPRNRLRRGAARPLTAISFIVAQARLSLLAVCLFAGCTKQPPQYASQSFSGDYPIQVVTTVGMVADVARNVGGDFVQVVQLCDAGVDPRTYQPDRDDIAEIEAADIVLYSGLKLESELKESLLLAARRKPLIALADGIDSEWLMQSVKRPGDYDPHVWLDVSLWSRTVAAVEAGLAKFDPASADLYFRNGAAYRARLEELHQYGLASLGTIPESQRVVVTTGDAFNYFGNAYRLRVEGFRGLSCDSEPGIQRMDDLVDLLALKGIDKVFAERGVPRTNIEALIQHASERGHELAIGGTLFSHAMGEPGTYEGTYEGMIDHNITVITRALGGQAPPAGLRGKLTSASPDDSQPDA